MSDHPSTSSAQQLAEAELVQGLARELDVSLSRKTLPLSDEATVKLDGYSEVDRVLCEAFARLRSPKAGQKRKLSTDILKLTLAGRVLEGSWRKVIVVACPEVHAWLTGRSWQALAAREFNIEVRIVPLSDETACAVRKAQGQQAMVNPHLPDA